MSHQEHKEQVAIFKWLSLQHPKVFNMTFAVPNGGNRTKMQNVRLKAEGLKAGVPDFMIMVSRGGYHGLCIEYKTKTGSASPAQREWIGKLNDEGYLAVICKGIDEVMALINSYLKQT